MDTLRTATEPHRFGPFALDRQRRVLTRNGEPLSLSRAEFDTLAFLVASDGRIVTKDELLAAVWPGRIVEESSISQAVYKLRQTLGDRRLILTESGRGYRFTGSPVETDASPAPRKSRIAVAFKDRGRVLQAVIGLGAVLLAVGRGLVALDPWGGLFHKDPAGLVVFADFQNQTGDPVFDRTLATAAEIDMRQSPHLTILTPQQVQDSLSLMMRPTDTPLTAAVAREVCNRNNGQEVLDGGVSRFGEHYLLTLTATRCADGQVIAAAKAEAASRETLLPTLDGLVDRVRRSLGESGASVDKFAVPLARRRTASLDALKAYSEATYLFDHGRRIESIPLYQQAIDLDPDFAMAYNDLGSAYLGLHDEHMIGVLTKAYALRDLAGEHDKLLITIRYGLDVERDQIAGIRSLRTMTDLYPGEASPWVIAASREDWMGLYAAAARDGRTGLALAPESELAHSILADAYMHAGRLTEARAVCTEAAARHIDGDRTHKVMFEIADALEDDAGVADETKWAEGKPGQEIILIDAGQAAASRGQLRLAAGLFARAVDSGKPAGFSVWFAAPYARLLNDVGLTAEARENLAKPPVTSTVDDYRAAMAEVGDPPRAETLIRNDIAKAPHDTVLNVETAPLVRATLALRGGRPADAIEALNGAMSYELRDFDVPYLRGRAYLATGDGAHAAAEFRKILDNRGVRPLSVRYPLARLGLARALRLQGDLAASRKAYGQFLADWKDADPDIPVLEQAKAEYAKL
jgi:DNA-binding winged helix-turn-helix (wHTH) protein/tetratricopeptide (TPR) repeat protein